MRGRTVVSICLILLFLVSLGAGAYATRSQVFMNDTGSVAYGLRVTFDRPVSVTDMGQGFSRWEAEESQTVILFKNGQIDLWGDFYFFWEPSSAQVLQHKWLRDLAMGTQETSAGIENDLMKGAVIRNHLAQYTWGDSWKYLNPLEILHRNGVEWLQARLTMAEHPLLQAFPKDAWSDIPCQDTYYVDPSLAYVEESLREAQNMGFKLNLCFLLSSQYTYSALQHRPPQWEGLSLYELADAVHDYCYETTRYFQERGIDIDLYDIGNEIGKGLVGFVPASLAVYIAHEAPWGIPEPENVDTMDFFHEEIWKPEAHLLKAAIAGVKEADSDAHVVIHVAYSPEAKEFFRTMVDLGVPFDYASVSYGTSAFQWTLLHCGEEGLPPCSQGQRFEEGGFQFDYLTDIATFLQRLGKKMIVGELTYPNAPLETVDLSRLLSEPLPSWRMSMEIPGYPFTPEGQASWLRDILTVCRNHPNIVGAFYYEPDFFPNACSGSVRCFSPGEINGLFADDTAILPAFVEFTSGPQEYPRVEMVDEKATSFQWSGRWDRHEDTKCVGGTCRHSSKTGARVDISFTGTGVSLIYVTNDNHGVADISIDGTKYDSIDMYSEALDTVFRITKSITRSLQPGEHVLTIEVSGRHNPSSSGNTVMVDAVDILRAWPEGTVPDSTPPSISDINLSANIVDTTDTHGEVKVTAEVSDADSGVAFVGIDLVNPSGENTLSTALYLKEGTSSDGVFEGVVQFPSQAEPGTWIVKRVLAGDMAYPEQNVLQLETDQLKAFELPFCIEVVSGGFSDRKEAIPEGQSLQQLIDEASSGSTIHLPSGVYDGNLVINKSITLVGKEGEERPWITGTNENSPVIAINSEGNQELVIQLEHLAIADGRGRNGNGIEAHGRIKLRLLDVELRNNEAHGVEVGDRVEVNISNCKFTGMGDSGIEFYGSTQGVIRDCTFVQNGAYGLWIGGFADVEILNSKINQNGYASIKFDGIYVYEGAKLRITQSEITNNCKCGIRTESPGNIALCDGNTVSGNGEGDYCGFSPDE